MKNIILKLIFLCSILPWAIFAQEGDTAGVQQDTSASNSPVVQMDTLTNPDVYVPTKDPGTALFRSAVLPGWGQYYNESYWKIPVFWGILGWCAYNYAVNNNNYSDYRDLYVNSGFSIESYRRLRDYYRDQRDLFVIYMGITYLANLLDAYVDANLFDFNVTEDNFTGSSMLNLRINF